jgi:hypothetical protein
VGEEYYCFLSSASDRLLDQPINSKDIQLLYLENRGDIEMNSYDNLIREIARSMDQQIFAIEAGGSEVLSSVVTDSRLHQIINNPVTEGIDEG